MRDDGSSVVEKLGKAVVWMVCAVVTDTLALCLPATTPPVGVYVTWTAASISTCMVIGWAAVFLVRGRSELRALAPDRTREEASTPAQALRKAAAPSNGVDEEWIGEYIEKPLRAGYRSDDS